MLERALYRASLLSGTKSFLCLATFVDNEQLKFEVAIFQNSVWFENINGGCFGLSFAPEAARCEATDTSCDKWEKHENGVSRFLARCMVAFSTFVGEQFPSISLIHHSNSALVDPYTDEAWTECNCDKKTFAKGLYWRVKYFETLGFKFDSTFADMVYTFSRSDCDCGQDGHQVEFSGDLLEIGKKIPDVYPECRLTRWEMRGED